jgi:23S rRNA (cytidine1920-2'-O)/16S rRNA (cytidine1409-2'-O)-methyltransferase
LRADVLLVKKGIVSSRNKAQELIDLGVVYSGDTLIKKSSVQIEETAEIFVRNQKDNKSEQYVARSSYKLLDAFDEFEGLSALDKVCLDVGASTGGFTQVLIEKGAKKVIALDVGHNQLSPVLKERPQVINCEGTDIRKLSNSLLEPHSLNLTDVKLVVCDVSFISLTFIFDCLRQIFADNEKLDCIFLVKPQFEIGRNELKKCSGGVVLSSALQEKAVLKVTEYAKECGLYVVNVVPSKTLGKKGNQEFLLYCKKCSKD